MWCFASQMQYLVGEEKSESDEPYQEISFEDIKLRMPPPQSLWAHVLWNSSKYLSQQIKAKTVDVYEKSVYEMGVGAGIPSMVSVQMGAAYVLMQEIPRDVLLDNIDFNLKQNLNSEQLKRVSVSGHYWNDVGKVPKDKFDLIFHCDLLSNHTEHQNLIAETKSCLKPDGTCHVLFSHHRPQYIEKDLRFFKIAEQEGFVITKHDSVKVGRMFPEDDEIYEIAPREWLNWYEMRLQ